MFKLFRNKTITVHLIDDSTSDPIETYTLQPEELPTSLDPLSLLTIADRQWQLIDASPGKPAVYLKTRKLTLFVVAPGQAGPERKGFQTPTISNDLPASEPISDHDHDHNNTFTIDLHADDWRQLEFLPQTLLSEIHHELAAVEAILYPKNKPNTKPQNSPNANPVIDATPTSFRQIHPRRLPRRTLSIPFDEACRILSITTTGSANFSRSGVQGQIREGFALQSPTHLFYGTRQGNNIKELALVEWQKEEQPNGSVQDLMKTYGLVLLDWRRAKIIKPLT